MMNVQGRGDSQWYITDCRSVDDAVFTRTTHAESSTDNESKPSLATTGRFQACWPMLSQEMAQSSTLAELILEPLEEGLPSVLARMSEKDLCPSQHPDQWCCFTQGQQPSAQSLAARSHHWSWTRLRWSGTKGENHCGRPWPQACQYAGTANPEVGFTCCMWVQLENQGSLLGNQLFQPDETLYWDFDWTLIHELFKLYFNWLAQLRGAM